MKKFYLLYFILYTLFSLVFIVFNFLDDNISYEWWNASTGSKCLPVLFVLVIPALILFISAGVSLIIARPVLRKYREADLFIDLAVVILAALAGWTALRYLGWRQPFPEFRIVYNLMP
ncbi:MAG: hypothetical protein LUF90_06180 [Rikenellaceae bacterium]|nr:hypothetical protein [Rikenellaceae bacterium]